MSYLHPLWYVRTFLFPPLACIIVHRTNDERNFIPLSARASIAHVISFFR